MDEIAQGAASVIVYMCALRIKKVNPLSWEKKDQIYLTRIQAWRRNRQADVTVRSSRVSSVVMVVIIGANWWGCMPRNLSLSITARISRGITRYERGEEGIA